MKSFFRNPSCLVAVELFLFCAHLSAQTNPVSPRIAQSVEETNLVRLEGNVHPLVQAKYDQGAVSDAKMINRMLLLLRRSEEQEASLKDLLDEQQMKSSANYHHWLTPEEFGKRFGPADADIQVVTDWLTSKGFEGIKVGVGRVVIEFRGNAGQVRRAFHTEIHNYFVNGEEHFANASDPQIPVVLAPVVAGVVALHNFPKQSQIHNLGTFKRTKGTGEVQPEFTYISCGSTGQGRRLRLSVKQTLIFKMCEILEKYSDCRRTILRSSSTDRIRGSRPKARKRKRIWTWSGQGQSRRTRRSSLWSRNPQSLMRRRASISQHFISSKTTLPL